MTAVAERDTTPGFGARFTAPLLLGSSLNPINSSMIATGLAGIGADFHRGPAVTASLVSTLYLCSAVAQPTMGKLAAAFGARRVYLSGVLILLLGGVVGAVAPAFGFLVVSRALIGVGTSAAYPTAMTLVRQRADRLGAGVPSRVLGSFSIAAQVTVVIGLPLGGVLTGVFGWRALFLVNVPLAALTFVLTWLGVHRDEPVRRTEPILTTVDAAGIALFGATIVSLLLFLGDLSSPTWWLLGAVVGFAALLTWWELRAQRPLVDVRMLGRNRALLRTYLRQTLVSLGTYIAMYGTSQWLEGVAGYSAAQVGLILIPLSVASIAVARVVSVHGWVRWPLALAGAALLSTGVVLFAVTSTAGLPLLIGVSLLFGLANGFGGFANQATLYAQAGRDEIGVASGLFRTFAYLGAIFSASLIGIAFGAHTTDSGLHVLAWVVAAIGVAVLALVLLDRRIPARAGDAAAPRD